MFRLFRKKETTGAVKSKAAVFVDYEHWYISLDKLYHIKPDIKSWRDKLAQLYDIRDILFFADFSNPSIGAEIPKIREVTNFIIETQNTSAHFKKDFTDFIMLDHIYQKAFNSKDIDTFIIFSGDGHFSSVTSFLTNQCGKTVGIYGVREAVSTQLKNTATWLVELPYDDELQNGYYYMILRNLKYLERNRKGSAKAHPTFRATVEAVSKYNNADSAQVTQALQNLMASGYIYQTLEHINLTRSIKILNVDWAKLRRAGIWKE